MLNFTMELNISCYQLKIDCYSYKVLYVTSENQKQKSMVKYIKDKKEKKSKYNSKRSHQTTKEESRRKTKE